MKVISVTGFKGGVGKTTTALHLAEYFGRRGFRTLILDGDPNASSLAIKQKSMEGLSFDVTPLNAPRKQSKDYEIVVIDSPARPEGDELNAMVRQSDITILPVSPDLMTVRPLVQTVTATKAKGRKYCLVSMVPPNSDRGQVLRDALRDKGLEVFNTLIRRTAAFTNANNANRLTCHLPSRQRKGWEDYEALGAEILSMVD